MTWTLELKIFNKSRAKFQGYYCDSCKQTVEGTFHRWKNGPVQVREIWTEELAFGCVCNGCGKVLSDGSVGSTGELFEASGCRDTT